MGNVRRDKGDGSIFQLKDGTWIAQLKHGKKANGKPNIKKFTGKKESEVKKKLKEFKESLIKNEYRQIKKMSVKEYMEKWMNDVQSNKLKPKTYDTKEATVNFQVYPYIGDLQINNLSADDIQKMINAVKDKGYSYSTIKKAYNAVNGCFRLGMIKGDIFKNPCIGVELPENKKIDYSKEIVIFDDEQIKRICEESVFKYGNGKQMYRLGHAIILLLYTGMRIAELLGLKWEDVDFEKKTISILNSVVMIRDRSEDAKTKYKLLEQKSTKTKSGDRIIPLNKKALDALQEIKKVNSNTKFVMSTSSGKIMFPRGVDRMFRNIQTRCNIDIDLQCGVHALRHTFASMLFKKGVDVKIVSELLGHADVATTYNMYIHLIKEQKQQAVVLMDEL